VKDAIVQLGSWLEYIQPGKPKQDAYIERYNRTVRYDGLGQYLFATIAEVQEFATLWLWTCNQERPNMAWEAACRNSEKIDTLMGLDRGLNCHRLQVVERLVGGRQPSTALTASGGAFHHSFFRRSRKTQLAP
jgi:hypothetical protein